MRDEVEEFLRRAAARRAQAEAKRREQQQQAAQPPRPQQQPIQRQPLVQRPPTVQVVQTEPLVEIIEAEVADTSSRFNTSVSQHLRGTNEIARHAASLGAEVDQADDKLEARLHKTFDHQLGQLKDTTTAAPVRDSQQTLVQPLAAMNLVQMLSNPQSIRNAIILSEVLNRPEQRWE